MTVAHSAPIYVDEPTWKREAPELVAHHRAQLRALLSTPIDPQQDLETWETAWSWSSSATSRRRNRPTEPTRWR